MRRIASDLVSGLGIVAIARDLIPVPAGRWQTGCPCTAAPVGRLRTATGELACVAVFAAMAKARPDVK